MKKFITFIVILICIFPLGKLLLNTDPNDYNENKKTSDNKTNSQPFSSSKKDEDVSIENDDSLDINNNEYEKSESILVDVGNNEYIVSVDSDSKEVVINENIYNSDKYIKVNYEEIIPAINDIEDYKNLSIPQYISLYNKFSPHIDTNMSYSELLSLASSININDLKSSYSEYIKIKNND